jgi:hypothetical protein
MPLLEAQNRQALANIDRKGQEMRFAPWQIRSLCGLDARPVMQGTPDVDLTKILMHDHLALPLLPNAGPNRRC